MKTREVTPEGGGIDLDDGALDKGVRSDKFVVGGVVHDTNQPRLPGDMLRSPGEVSGIQSESTVLGVSTTDTNGVDTLGSELGAGRLTTELELSLLPVVCTLRTRLRPLVAAGS